MMKYVFIKSRFILHECSYTEDATNLYRKYANSRKHFKRFGKTHKLQIKMRKTEPRGKVFKQLLGLQTEKSIKP